MPAPFFSIPIRLKILASFSITLFFFATLNFIYYPKVHEKQALDYIESHLQNMAEAVALSTAVGLENMDFSSFGRTTDWAKQESSLIYLGIFDTGNDAIGIFLGDQTNASFCADNRTGAWLADAQPNINYTRVWRFRRYVEYFRHDQHR